MNSINRNGSQMKILVLEFYTYNEIDTQLHLFLISAEKWSKNSDKLVENILNFDKIRLIKLGLNMYKENKHTITVTFNWERKFLIEIPINTLKINSEFD